MRDSNILLIRLSAMGDIAMASPVIKVLKGACPGCRLTWLVEDRFVALLRGHPRLDEVIAWPREHWKGLMRERRYNELFREFDSFKNNLRGRRFDLALDMQGILKSAVWTWLSGARERVGINSREGTSFLMSEVVRADRGDPLTGSEYRAMLRHLGMEPGQFWMDLHVEAGEEEEAKKLLSGSGVHGRYFALCPFTTRPQKHWLEDRWKSVAADIAANAGLTAVLLGGPADRPAAERISGGTAIVNLAGKTTMRQAIAILKSASLMAGVDTGLTHIGIGFGVPSVAIFGATRPYLETPNPRAVVLYKKEECSPCRRRPVCKGGFRCMEAVSSGEVVQAALSVIR